MKKPRLVSFCICLMMLWPALAYGEGQSYSIQELSNATSSHWQETYEAHGRTISVDVEIEIPCVETAPVLLVRTASPLPDARVEELQAFCTSAMEKDEIHSYSFQSTPFSTAYDHATPPMWGKTRKDDASYNQAAMGWDSHLLSDYRMDAAYADHNPLLLGDAVTTAKKQVSEFFPNDALALTNVAVFDRTFSKKTGEPISEKGYYHLEFHQIFHGIPFMGSVHSTFSTKAVGDENYLLESRGCASVDVWDEDSFLLKCLFYEESGVVCEDIPLLPFDDVKGKVEALIRAGYIRAVDRVALGYGQYDTENPQEQLLLPSWVVWVEYQQDGPLAERSGPFYTDGWLEDEPYYRPMILNAQTGEMVDPENNEYGRCLAPAIKQ